MLGVHRQHNGAALAAGLADEPPADDEAFLVGQRDALAPLRRRQRGQEARRTDDGREQKIVAHVGRDVRVGRGANQDFRRVLRRKQGLELARGGFIQHGQNGRAEGFGLFGQPAGVAPPRKGGHMKQIAVLCHHAQSADADGPRAAQHCQASREGCVRRQGRPYGNVGLHTRFN